MTGALEREAIARAGAHLAARGLAPGTSGNISCRLDGVILLTPTNASLGALDPARLSLLDEDGELIAGDPSTKEAGLHLAVYRARPSARAIVHLHAPYSVALACLRHDDPRDVLPKLTPYAVMRVGTLPLVPYAPPGHRALVEAVALHAAEHHAVLLANHGPVVSAQTLESAVATSEELEEAAKLSFLLQGRAVRALSEDEVAVLTSAYRIS